MATREEMIQGLRRISVLCSGKLLKTLRESEEADHMYYPPRFNCLVALGLALGSDFEAECAARKMEPEYGEKYLIAAYNNVGYLYEMLLHLKGFPFLAALDHDRWPYPLQLLRALEEVTWDESDDPRFDGMFGALLLHRAYRKQVRMFLDAMCSKADTKRILNIVYPRRPQQPRQKLRKIV